MEEPCCICYGDMHLPGGASSGPSLGRRTDLVWCRQGCGHNMHGRCLQVWARHQTSKERELTCPLCRAAWGPFSYVPLRRPPRARLEGAHQGRGPTSGGAGHHPGSSCTGCKQAPIPGALYSCRSCASLQLCSRCFRAGLHPEHAFLVRSTPVAQDAPAVREGLGLTATGLRQGPASPLMTSSPARHKSPARSASARRCAATDAPACLAEGMQLAGTALTGSSLQQLEERLSSHAEGAAAASCTQQRRVTSTSNATHRVVLATPQHHQQPCWRAKTSAGLRQSHQASCSPALSACKLHGNPEQLVQHAEAGPLGGMNCIAADRRHSDVPRRGLLRKQQLALWRPSSSDRLRDHGGREADLQLVGTSKGVQQPSAEQPGKQCPPNSSSKTGMQGSKLPERTAHKTKAADGSVNDQAEVSLQVQGSQLDRTPAASDI